MKKIMIKGSILVLTFLLSLVGSVWFLNRNRDTTSANMAGASLPRIAFYQDGYLLNPLVGYTEEMELASMRDAILPVYGDGKISVQVKKYGNQIKGLSFTTYSIDGETEKVKGIGEKTEGTKDEDQYIFHVKESFDGAEEEEQQNLKIAVELENRTIYYYTRIVRPTEGGTKANLDFALNVHQQALGKIERTTLPMLMESGSSDGGNGFERVTIGSSYEQMTWDGLEPEVINKEEIKLVETNSVYSSIIMSYRVSCKGETEERDIYEVEEFFRVRGNSGTLFLLNYERKMKKVLNYQRGLLMEDGIRFGLNKPDLYMTSGRGKKVAFTQNRELFYYDVKKNRLSLVFSFDDKEGNDERDLYNQNDIQIISMDKSGNMVFTVYGYMNRGEHEGQVGVAIYSYYPKKNVIDEQIFIPTNQSYILAKESLKQFSYFQEKNDILYLLSEGTLYQIEVTGKEIFKNQMKVLAEGLTSKSYVHANGGKKIAYRMKNEKGEEEIRVLDMETGESQSYQGGEDTLYPLGFVEEDFICGYGREEDKGVAVGVEAVHPMYKIVIYDKEQKELKTYQQEKIYIEDVSVDGDVITLTRFTKEEDGGYKTIPEDYISKNEKQKDKYATLEKEESELFGEVYVLKLSEKSTGSLPQVVETKQVLHESIGVLSLKNSELSTGFYVYAGGEMTGHFERASDAIEKADFQYGVVTDGKQHLVWERGNRDLVYRIEGIDKFKAREGQSAKTACIERLKAFTGQEQQEWLDLTGCSSEQILYLINKKHPVLAMTGGEEALLMIGYSEWMVEYIDPITGEYGNSTFEDMNQLLQKSGYSMYTGSF